MENGKGKLEIWNGSSLISKKIQGPFFFFFFCFSLLKTTETSFGSTKMGNFLPGRDKHYHARKKIKNTDFAPSEAYAC